MLCVGRREGVADRVCQVAASYQEEGHINVLRHLHLVFYAD